MDRTRCHGVDVTRCASQRLRDHVAFGIKDATGKVQRLPHNGAKGGADQCCLLFIGD